MVYGYNKYGYLSNEYSDISKNIKNNILNLLADSNNTNLYICKEMKEQLQKSLIHSLSNKESFIYSQIRGSAIGVNNIDRIGYTGQFTLSYKSLLQRLGFFSHVAELSIYKIIISLLEKTMEFEVINSYVQCPNLYNKYHCTPSVSYNYKALSVISNQELHVTTNIRIKINYPVFLDLLKSKVKTWGIFDKVLTEDFLIIDFSYSGISQYFDVSEEPVNENIDRLYNLSRSLSLVLEEIKIKEARLQQTYEYFPIWNKMVDRFSELLFSDISLSSICNIYNQMLSSFSKIDRFSAYTFVKTLEYASETNQYKGIIPTIADIEENAA